MAAFGLSSINCDGSDNLLERVRVIQADTLSMVQGGFTAGSTTSESSCEAVRLCCTALVERLIPLKERLQENMGTMSWDTLIIQAQQGVNLSASTLYVPDYTSMHYLNYGAAVSEVSCLPPSVLDRERQSQFSMGCRVILPPDSFLTLRLPFVYGVQLEDRSSHPLNYLEHQPELTAWITKGTALEVMLKESSLSEDIIWRESEITEFSVFRIK